jgi:hypothetical protein
MNSKRSLEQPKTPNSKTGSWPQVLMSANSGQRWRLLSAGIINIHSLFDLPQAYPIARAASPANDMRNIAEWIAIEFGRMMRSSAIRTKLIAPSNVPIVSHARARRAWGASLWGLE